MVMRIIRWGLLLGLALVTGAAVFIAGYGLSRGYDVPAGFATLLDRPEDPVPDNPALQDVPWQQVTWLGDIEDRDLAESSGLAVSNRRPDVLWSINDSGDGPHLYAMTLAGKRLGRWRVATQQAVDWEALDSFEHDGVSYLIVGDIGDNLQWRDLVTLLIVPEPDLQDSQTDALQPAWRIQFTYPDGARDSEAMAVDTAAQVIYVLTKRDIPPVLYKLPLRPESPGEPLVAERVGNLRGFPRPTELDYLEMEDAHWRHLPTGMDLADGRLLVTTLRHAYLFDATQPLLYPVRVRLPVTGQREAIAFAKDRPNVAYVSKERYRQTGVAEIFEVEFALPSALPD